MTGNVLRKESMQKEYCKSRSEHDKEDLKKTKKEYQPARELQTLEVLGMRGYLHFWGSKRVFASNDGPKGRNRGQGTSASLLNLL